jgi:hypothetical protein
MEDQVLKDETSFTKKFKSSRRPVLLGQIKHLENVCFDLKCRIEDEAEKGAFQLFNFILSVIQLSLLLFFF